MEGSNAFRGLQRMITEDKYCIDVHTQVNSVSAALKGVAIGLLDEHVRHCVMEATEQGMPKGPIVW
jgi:CsoR family transcriptional regulator, copper-sensing transcriptional repressor